MPHPDSRPLGGRGMMLAYDSEASFPTGQPWSWPETKTKWGQFWVVWQRRTLVVDRNSIPFIGLDIATSFSSESSSSDIPPRVLDSGGGMPSNLEFDARDLWAGPTTLEEGLETMSDEAVVRVGKASRDCAIESDQERILNMTSHLLEREFPVALSLRSTFFEGASWLLVVIWWVFEVVLWSMVYIRRESTVMRWVACTKWNICKYLRRAKRLSHRNSLSRSACLATVDRWEQYDW